MIDPQNINWQEIEVVIFDVDGTLYDQSKLRRKMALSLGSYYLLRPWRVYELQVINAFRKERERRNLEKVKDIEQAQYDWCAQKVKYPVEKIRQIIHHWMFSYPIKYFSACAFKGVNELFETLQKKGKKIAVYSDYPSNEKLKAMNLKADLVISSTEKAINALKPDPTGLNLIINHFNTSPQKCLFIGDREELDGKCASNAKMPYLIIERSSAINTYKEIKEQVQQLNYQNK